jgi:hypothetical protein
MPLRSGVEQLLRNLFSYIARPARIRIERHRAQWVFVPPSQNVIDDRLLVGACLIDLAPDIAWLSAIVQDLLDGQFIIGGWRMDEE